MPDFLEHLWSEVINIDPQGKWIDASIRRCKPFSRYASCAPALERLRKIGKLEDIGRISRFIRFETTSAALYSFEDPGLPKISLANVLKDFASLAHGEKPAKPGNKYITSFDLSTDP